MENRPNNEPVINSGKSIPLSTEDFGTLVAVKTLIEKGRAKSVDKALGMIEGLNFSQKTGMAFYDLTRKEVQVAKYGRHTVDSIDELERLGFKPKKAYEKVKGLNASQADKVVKEVTSSLKSPLGDLTKTQLPKASEGKPLEDITNKRKATANNKQQTQNKRSKKLGM